jgi:Tfp pilus tip-associated adhesin PilY1
VNSTIPPTSTLTTCSATPLSAWTIAIDPATGGALTDAFFQYANGNYINVTSTTAGETATQGVSSVSDLGIGTPTSVTYNGQMFVISSPLPPGASPPPAGMLPSGSAAPFLGHGKPPSVKRWSWVERR